MPDQDTDATITENVASDTDGDGTGSGASGTQTDVAASGRPEGQSDGPDDPQALIRKLLSENKGLRKTKTEAQNRLQKIEDAQKTEAERLTERVTALEAENSKLLADRNRATLQQLVQRHGVRPEYADLVAERLEREGLDYDESGQPVDVESKLPALRTRYAALFSPVNGRGAIDAAAGRNSSATGDWFTELMR